MLFRSDELKTVALENISSNVMIADNAFNIVYINGALRNFFSEKDADIKKIFPEYSLDKLVGQNIDIFHKDPSHQRRMIEGLSKSFSTTIEIGASTFDLIAQPILGKSGKRLGTMVEWKDAALRLQIADHHGQAEAVSRSYAVIRFTPEGQILDCNDNFLNAVGYQKSELIGNHHSMFVDKEYSKSKEYSDFWDILRSGKFHSGQYQRVDKHGNELWLQATYNPLLDQNGNVVAVIKFASDISEETKRRQRATDAQQVIANDLQGIAQSVSTANERAQNSSTASQEAASNVQSVSAGIEELAASVKEINRQVTDASRISSDAVVQAQTTNEIVSKMSDAAQEIANVVNLISDIAEQTNLLALNATIEAARAGEAGRGFSVVASEVKELASQTSKATEEIGSRIVNVQNTSVEAVEALKEITDIINNISEISTSISGAVEEQSVTMNEMSSNMTVASNGVQTMDKAISDIANSITSIDETTQKVREASSALT